MSDYESDSSVPVAKPTPAPKPKKSATKRRGSEAHSSGSKARSERGSDYESDNSVAEPKPTPAPKLKKSAIKRRGPEAHSSGLKSSKKNRATDLFKLEEDVEAQNPIAKRSSDLGSSIVNKVANGKIRRSGDLLGEFYVDLKIYSKADIVSTPPEERWKKAAVTLKVQLNQESPQWDHLQKFIKRSHDLFHNSEPIFYSDKVSFK